MQRVFRRKDAGTGMILALFAMMIVFTLSVSFVSLTWNSLRVSKRDVMRARALACAESGIDQAIFFLMSGGPNGELETLWRGTYTPSTPPAPGRLIPCGQWKAAASTRAG